MMLTKHKNALLSVIKNSHFDPKLFGSEIGSIDGEDFFIIRLLNSSLQFAVRPRGEFKTFYYRSSFFTPGFPLSNLNLSISPEDLVDTFKDWLDSTVKPYLDDLNTPDLWQTLEDTWSETIGEIDTQDYLEPFSYDEKTRINLAIEKFQVLLVSNFNPSKETLNDIKNSLKYLSNATDKQTKFQWKILALSIVLNIAFNLALDPEKFRQLIQLFKEVFSNIIYLLP